jgi:hypothetical protein
MKARIVLLLFCCLFSACRYYDGVFGPKPDRDCRKWTDAQQYGFHGPVKGLCVEQGFAVKKGDEWALDTGSTHLFYNYSFHYLGHAEMSMSLSGDRLVSYTYTTTIDNDYVVHYELLKDDPHQLFEMDTLHWLDTFHAVWKHYRVEEDTSVPHRLYREKAYTLDRQCRVTDILTNTWDSGCSSANRRAQRIKGDVPNNHLLSATEFDPETTEVVSRDRYGNPVKVLLHCKECAKPCLKVYRYTY